jgi:CBS domain-containing protein
MKTSVVADVMTSRVLTARPAMPLKELARVLAEHHISALPVLDPDDRVIGIVSERDLLPKQANPIPRRRRWWQRLWQRRRTREDIRRAEGDTVGHVMSGYPITIAPGAALAEAARRMTEHEVKHLPVVDENGELVGIVSRADLIRTFMRSDDETRDDVLIEVFRHVLWTDPTEVDVSVTDGIVTLAGTVEQRSTAEIAERLVHRLDGVVDVISTLEYRLDDGGITGRPARHPQPTPTTTATSASTKWPTAPVTGPTTGQTRSTT